MAKQISLFGDSDGGEADQSGTCPEVRRRRRDAFDPAALPVPEKLGPARVRFGTSSWTYPGWHGQVYRDVEAYGAKGRFDKLSLGEYVRDPRFRTVGADNMYYAAPADRLSMLQRYRQQLEAVPGFDLCPKVWHGVTVQRYTALQQHQWHVPPEENPLFLDADAFLDAVLLPLQAELGEHLGPLMLEVQENDLAPDAFALLLDRFLDGALARASFRLVVELRQLAHLTPRYLAVLRAHGAGHALSSWTRMPPIGWQLDQVQQHGGPGPGPVLVRALLRPGQLRGGGEVQRGRRYEEAVKKFQPYDRLQEPQPQVRSDILRVIDSYPGEIHVLVNNRLEGNAPGTIDALLAALSQGTR